MSAVNWLFWSKILMENWQLMHLVPLAIKRKSVGLIIIFHIHYGLAGKIFIALKQ
jgi:hypothetical protein